MNELREKNCSEKDNKPKRKESGYIGGIIISLYVRQNDVNIQIKSNQSTTRSGYQIL